MTVFAARLVVIVAAVAGAVVAGALLVREAMLALDESVTWNLPDWWGWLTERPGALRSLVAAVLAGVAALICLYAAMRLVRRPMDPSGTLDLGKPDASVIVEASTLDKLLAKALDRRLPELDNVKVWLFREGEAYRARVLAHLRACVDLFDLQERVSTVVQHELRTATGLELVHLDLDIERLDLRRKGGS